MMQYSIGTRTVVSDLVIIEGTLFQGLGSLIKEGGAIFISSYFFVDIRFCLFDSNIGLVGGGIFSNLSSLHLYSTCFSCCYSDRTDKSDGGNAVTFLESQFFTDLVSAEKCSPQISPCGDGVFNGVSSTIYAIHTNCSSCKGIAGECCFGNNAASNSTIKFLNVVFCDQYTLIWVPGGNVYSSNFIDNSVSGFLVYSYIKISYFDHCYFFGNTKGKNDVGTVSYSNCYGDETRTGITKLESTVTQPQTPIIFRRCIIHHFFQTAVPPIRCKNIIILPFLFIRPSDYLCTNKLII